MNINKQNLNQENLGKPLNKSIPSSYLLPESSDITARHNPVMTKQWSNGIYNYNNNFIKNIPSADIMVNKIIKSYFSLNPISSNPNGKKSKLLKRRYKRLSLNRILVSKPEIKHDNNKVNITVYLFNKKKLTLLNSINSNIKDTSKLSRTMPITTSIPFNILNKANSKEKVKPVQKYLNKTSKRKSLNTGGLYLRKQANSFFRPSFLGLASTQDKTQNLINQEVINKVDNITTMININQPKKNKFNNKRFVFNNKYIIPLKNTKHNNKYKSRNLAFKLKAKNKYFNFKGLDNLAKNKIKSISRFNKISHNYYVLLNKYRLLDRITNDVKVNKLKSRAAFVQETYKLKTRYKNFKPANPAIKTLYNKACNYISFLLSTKLKIKNIFRRKGLKKLDKKGDKYILASTIRNIDKNLLSTVYPRTVIKQTKKIYLGSALSNVNKNVFNSIRSNPKQLKLNRITYYDTVVMRSNALLMKKINKINLFVNKYESSILPSANRIDNSIYTTNVLAKASLPFKNEFEDSYGNTVSNIENKNYNLSSVINLNHINYLYKSRFIKEILDKEIMYLNYIKLLCYNNTLFKSWFLTPLRDIISKIYNKKVELNLVNLKYIHLNSDILLQAVALRLRNIKKNRLNKVLSKTLALVKLSKINSYARDVRSPIYKYIEQHFNRFKNLNTLIFNDIVGKTVVNSRYKKIKANNTVSNSSYVPINTKWLSDVQTSTINFIKYKTVFGLKLEASGRLTKRSTASRAIFKFRYKGNLKNNPAISRDKSSTIIKANRISNLQYAKISSKTRNGSFGLKSWINTN